MENHAWDVTTAQSEEKIFSNLYPMDRKFSLVATADIGKAGADVSCQEWKGTRYIEVAGPRAVFSQRYCTSIEQLARTYHRTVAVPREKWTEFFVGQGMPVGRTEPRAEMVDGFNSGWIHFGVAGAEHVTGNTSLRSVIGKLATNGSQEE